MNCREAVDHLYEYLDQELTPEIERAVRQHLVDCQPCLEQFDFDEAFLKFLQARCRSRCAPSELKRRILHELFGE